MLDLVQERSPDWGPGIAFAFQAWRAAYDGHRGARKTLEPLDDRLLWVWMVYPGDNAALARSSEVIEVSGLGMRELGTMIDPVIAGSELLRHALLELWLAGDRDLEALYKACPTAFSRDVFPRRLIEAYLLRLAPFREPPSPLLLSNERLLPLILRMAEASQDVEEGRGSEDQVDLGSSEDESDDVVAFEIFRRIISPRLDPLTASSVDVIADILSNREHELVALKGQCDKLSEQLVYRPGSDPQATIDKFMRRHVADDLANVLRLSERTKQEVLARLLSDPIAWTGVLAAAAGGSSGRPTVSVAAGIAAIARVLSKGVEVGWEQHKELRDDPYRLVRRLGEKRTR